MSVPPIRDNYEFRKFDAELKQLEYLRLLQPLLRWIGPEGKKAGESIGDLSGTVLPKLRADLDRLRSLPDEFNAIFANYGWIAHEDFDVNAMEKAINLAKTRDIESAEAFLEDHYNESFDFHIRRVVSLPLLKDRRRLIELALADHQAGRYHSSIPIVLGQIDGITVDLLNSSFFGKGSTQKLKANETIVGHPSGLPTIADRLSEPRFNTSNAATDLPYRHGTLHGRDLQYDSRRNSTKAFATLLAMRVWIIKVQRGEQFTLPPQDDFEPKPVTWADVKKLWQQIVEATQRYATIKEEQEKLSLLTAEDEDLDRQTEENLGTIDFDVERALLKDYLIDHGVTELKVSNPKPFLDGELTANFLLKRDGPEAWINVNVTVGSTDLSEIKNKVYLYAYDLLLLIHQSKVALNRFVLSFHIQVTGSSKRKGILLRTNRTELDQLFGSSIDPFNAVEGLKRKVIDRDFDTLT